MTPFQIRRRLKKLMGMGDGASSAPVEPARPSFDVTFECPDGTSYVTQAKEGDSLVLAAGRGSQPISTGCTDSSCGTCRVDVLAGAESLTDSYEHELKTKADVGVPDAQRLGCQAGVIGPGVRVRIVNVLGEELIDP
jgi:ferredoxin